MVIDKNIKDKIVESFEKTPSSSENGAIEGYTAGITHYKTTTDDYEILNIDDYPVLHHQDIVEYIEKRIIKGFEHFVNYLEIVNQNGKLKALLILDIAIEGNIIKQGYHITNIRLSFDTIDLIRVTPEDCTQTGLYTPDSDKIRCQFYNTEKKYISTIEETKKFELLKDEKIDKIIEKNKKIRFDSKTGKLYIR